MVGMVLVFLHPGFAAMGSSNYVIPTSVLSGGGAPMSSAGFQTNFTLGQSSPISQTFSGDYTFYSGFWYTLTKTYCFWDFEPDGDVDGMDLETFIQGFGSGGYDGSDLESFVTEFGKTECPK